MFDDGDGTSAEGQIQKVEILKIVIPNSAVSKIMGPRGCLVQEMAQEIGCRINISRRNQCIQERVVLLVGQALPIHEAAILILKKI